MADPTIQAFCDVNFNFNTTEKGLLLIRDFNTTSYNAVSLFSSTVGVLGALYQVLPRREYSRNHRWVSFSAARGRKIILWLSVADFLATLGVLIRAALWLNNKHLAQTFDHSHLNFCTITSAWIQFFYTSTWIWTLCYAIDMRFILREKEEKLGYYHLAAWIIPAFLTATGLLLVYLPQSCYTSDNVFVQNLPNYFALYIPIAGVMIANPILYLQSCKDMEKIIVCSSGQFTQREREIIDSIKIKFAAINIVYYACWIPNLINGLIIWLLWFDLPYSLIASTWYMMAFMNPLQAFFNTLVYRRWNSESEILVLPWSRNNNTEMPKSPSSRNTTSSKDSLPLLEKNRENNKYRTFT